MNLPATIDYELQPYTSAKLGNLRLVPNRNVAGSFDLIGDVIEGKETARLFQFTSTKDIPPGTEVRVWGIKQYELDAGRVVRVAM